MRSVAEPRAELVEALGVEARRTDHGVDAVLHTELEGVHHHAGVGEVDDRLGSTLEEQVEGVVDVDLGDQLEVAGLLTGGRHRRAHLAPDLAPGTDDADLECAHGGQPRTTPTAHQAAASTSNGGSGSSSAHRARSRSRAAASSVAT